MIDEKLLELLACPQCKKELLVFEDFFVCENCLLKFEIVDGIPNFLLDDAKQITLQELQKIKDEK